jgi:lipoprotein-releasing system permease protein
MKFKLILNIAVHLLKARLKQTVVAAVGVTFGIAMFIALVSFMNGLNELLDGLMLNRTPHVLLYNEVKQSDNQPLDVADDYKNNTNFINSIKPKDRGKSIYNGKAIIKVLKEDSRVIDVAPKVTSSVLFNSGTIEIAGFVNGIDMVAEDKLPEQQYYYRERISGQDAAYDGGYYKSVDFQWEFSFFKNCGVF